MADAGPVRAHVQALRAQRMGYVRIAEVAGVSVHTLKYLLYGNTSQGSPVPQKVRAETARKLLAVKLDIHPRRGIDATGTRRRVQALTLQGYALTWQALEVGIHHRSLQRIACGQTFVERRIADAVRGLYDRLWDTPAPDSPTAKRVRTVAKHHGYVPPLAWDDSEIDDPKARPRFGARSCRKGIDEVLVMEVAAGRREPARMTHGERQAAFVLMRRWGCSGKEAISRLRLSRGTYKAFREQVAA